MEEVVAIEVDHSPPILLLLLLWLVLGREQLLITLATALDSGYRHATQLHCGNALVQIKVVGGQNVVALLLDLYLWGGKLNNLQKRRLLYSSSIL